MNEEKNDGPFKFFDAGKDYYIYNGPVMEFERIVSDNWQGETYASSEKKARSNLAYQFKKQHHRVPSTKIILPGKLICMDPVSEQVKNR